MTGSIPESVIEKIRENSDIVEVISGYLSLKKAGRNYKAVCPFHNEKTPSFVVNPDKQIFHCFGCGEGGNVFGFVMKIERINFVDSVKLLAQRSGLNIEFSEKTSRESEEKNEIFRINEEAAELYYNCLLKDSSIEARKYLNERQLDENTIKKFKIGYAPGGAFLVKELTKKNFSQMLIKKSILGISRESGFQDFFRKRIIFPIFDIQSRAIGFGARIFNEDTQPKYLNTPETPVFSKGRNLYGFNITKEAVRKLNEAIIVEGYMDFLALYKNKIENVVASLGTALTENQILLLKRYAEKIILCYDADAAGQEATLRGLALLMEKDIDPRIVVLPSGDPDSFIKKNGRQVFIEKIKNAMPLLDYYFHVYFSRYDSSTIEGKIKISSEFFPLFSKIKDGIKRSECLKRLAEKLKVDEKTIYSEFERITKKQSVPISKKDVRDIKLQSIPANAESVIIRLALQNRSFAERIFKELEEKDFKNDEYRKIFKIIFDIFNKYDIINIQRLLDNFEDETCISLITSLIADNSLNEENSERLYTDCVRSLKNANILDKRNNISQELKKAEKEGQTEKIKVLLKEYQKLEEALRRKN